MLTVWYLNISRLFTIRAVSIVIVDTFHRTNMKKPISRKYIRTLRKHRDFSKNIVQNLDRAPRRRAERKSQSAKPTTWNDSLTLKTTPQAPCGAYIKNAPCGFIPQGAGYMDLSAVFSLAAVKDGAGQSSTRSQHYRNPQHHIAVVAGFRGSGFAGCRGVRISIV